MGSPVAFLASSSNSLGAAWAVFCTSRSRLGSMPQPFRQANSSGIRSARNTRQKLPP